MYVQHDVGAHGAGSHSALMALAQRMLTVNLDERVIDERVIHEAHEIVQHVAKLTKTMPEHLQKKKNYMINRSFHDWHRNIRPCNGFSYTYAT